MLGRRDLDNREGGSTSSRSIMCQASGTVQASNDLPEGNKKV